MMSYSGLAVFFLSFCASFWHGQAALPWQIDEQTVQLATRNNNTGATITLRLWTPPGISKLRGVIVCGPGSNQQSTDVGLKYAQVERWQILAQNHAFGLVGVQWTTYSGGNPLNALDPFDDLDQGLAQIGVVSNHPELAVVPVVVWGMSASGGFSMGYANARPNRCIAWSDNKGATVASYDLSQGLSVPGLLTYSEYGLTLCPHYSSHPGTPDYVCSTYVSYRKQGALLTIIPDWGVDHVEWGYGNYFAIAYFDQVIEARLPANYQPGTAANLVTLSETDGWLGTLNNFGYTEPWTRAVVGSYCYCPNPTIPAIVKRSLFTGSNADALNAVIYTWLPNEYLARLWQAASIYTHGVAVTSPNQWNSDVSDSSYVFNSNVSAPIVASAQNGYTITGIRWYDGLTQFDQNPTGASLSTQLKMTFGLHPIRTIVNTSYGNQTISGFSLLGGRNGTGPIFVTAATASLSALVNGAVTLSALAVPTGLGVNNPITYTWSMVSGPGTVTFGSSNGLSTASSLIASVSSPGTYVIKVVARNVQPYAITYSTSQTSVTVLTVAPVVAYLPFDEGQGSTAIDASGKGNSASLINGPTWATGVVGNDSCVVFSKPASQYAALPSGAIQNIGNYCTIAVWVNPKTSNTWQRVFDFGSGTNNYMFLTTIGGKGVVTFGIRTPSVAEQDIFGNSPLPVGVWSHVAVVLSQSTGGSLYVNGTLVGSNPNMTISPNSLGATSQNWLGRSQFADPYLDGSLEDFRLYKIALSQIAIQALASSTQTALSTLRMNLAFDEGAGSVAQDRSGNGWSATLQGAPGWTAGKSDSAIYLNSTSSQYATLPNGVVNGLTACTISLWVNLQTVVNWQRVFDFGTGTTNYMFVTPSAGGSNAVRFAIRTPFVAEQQINGGTALPTGAWTHVAVVLNGPTGTLYVNGLMVGNNTAMTLTPSSLGITTQNRIGRSQFNDPTLNGIVDDFRIYGAPLTAAQIATLAS